MSQRDAEVLVERTAAAAFPGEYVMWPMNHRDQHGGLWSVSVSPDCERYHTVWVLVDGQTAAVVPSPFKRPS